MIQPLVSHYNLIDENQQAFIIENIFQSNFGKLMEEFNLNLLQHESASDN